VKVLGFLHVSHEQLYTFIYSVMLETSVYSVLSQCPVPIAPKISVLFFYMTWVEILHVSHEHHETCSTNSIDNLQSLYPVSYLCKNNCSLHESVNGFSYVSH
jgi:hypothetical protein